MLAASQMESNPASSSKEKPGKQQAIISYSLTHPMYDCPVGIKTCLGQPEKIAPLKKGKKGGFCVADFGEGDEETECANLLLEIAQAPKQPPKKKAKGKAKAKGKKKGKAKAKGKKEAKGGDGGEAAKEKQEDDVDEEEEEEEQEGGPPAAEKAPAAEEPPTKKAKQVIIFF